MLNPDAQPKIDPYLKSLYEKNIASDYISGDAYAAGRTSLQMSIQNW